MILLQTIQSTLVEVYELLKKSIKDRKPTQYAGQNLSKLAEDFRDDAKKLTIAGFYDHGLTLTMLKIFLEAGGDVGIVPRTFGTRSTSGSSRWKKPC
jgi:hypothetical protein